jgi:hypothetical protein
MKLKKLTIIATAGLVLAGCGGLKPASISTGADLNDARYVILKNSLDLISLDANKQNAVKSLQTLTSCDVRKGNLLTVSQLQNLKANNPGQFDNCWANISDYMQSGDRQVMKGGKYHSLAQNFKKHWSKQSL